MKHVYRAIVLVAVFVASIFLMSNGIKENVFDVDKTVVMENASFPILYVDSGEQLINRLYGYSSNISANTMRESMTVLNSEKSFYVCIDENESNVKRLKYEVREVYDNTVIDSGSVSALEEKDGMKAARIKFTSDLVIGKEYAVKLTLITKTSKKINYYTRVKVYDYPRLKEKLDFVMDFHKATFDKEKSDRIVAYLEPNSSMDNKSFAHVNIHSSFDLITWGSLKPEILSDVVPTIKEIDSETASIELNYLMKAKTSSGEELYNVKEFYRIRYTPTRVYLLNFDRTMEAYFDVNRTSLTKNEFKIGITEQEDFDLVSTEDNNKICFVRNGSLWYYNYPENNLVEVFSFLKKDSLDIRNFYDQHDIRILDLEDNGNIDFIVYGYMNSGDYEGRVGILLYKYYAAENRIEEQVYIPMEIPYQLLKEDLNDFCYLTNHDVFYFEINNNIYAYNIITRSLKEVATNVTKESSVLPQDGEFIAWQNSSDDFKSKEIILYDLETGSEKVIKAGTNENIKLLGSIGSNIIYGRAKSSNLMTTSDGTVVVPMHKVYIGDKDGKTLKEYSKKNFYVTGASVEENVITLKRVKKENGSADHVYVKAEDDHIINKSLEQSDVFVVSTRVTDKSLTEKYISLPYGFVMTELPLFKQTLNTVITEDTTLHFGDKKPFVERYYVYGYGKVLGAYQNAGDAIVDADNAMGVVTNYNQQVIWERGGKSTRASLNGMNIVNTYSGKTSKEACVEMVLAYNGITPTRKYNSSKESMFNFLEDFLPYEVVNLTGSSLEQVLYYISKQRPVIGLKENGQAVIITGYDEFNITYIEPTEDKVKKVGLKDGAAMFKRGSNIFISYITN